MPTPREALDRLAELEWRAFELAPRAAVPAPRAIEFGPVATPSDLAVVIVSRDQGRALGGALASVRRALRPRALVVADAGGGLFTRQRLLGLADAGVATLALPAGGRGRAANAALLATTAPLALVIEASERLTPEAAAALQGLAPLSFVTVVGRVRTARSKYLGNPILDLVDYDVAR